MTASTFVFILTIGATLSSLLTEAVKKFCEGAKINYSSNILALVDSVIIGGGGTAVVYALTGASWNTVNIVSLILMVFAVWLGCMVGFDKVIQTAGQIGKLSEKKEEPKAEPKTTEVVKTAEVAKTTEEPKTTTEAPTADTKNEEVK